MKKLFLAALSAIILLVGLKYVVFREAADFLSLQKHAARIENLPGGDLATHYFASKVRNPYDNVEYHRAFLEGKFSFSHPNPALRLLPLKNIPFTYRNGELEILDHYGFVATPWVLLHFKALSALPFTVLYDIWPWLSLLVLTTTVSLYSFRLFDHAGRTYRTIAALVCACLLGQFFFPVMNSSFHFMQLELLYIPPLVGCMTLFLFYRDRKAAPMLIGFLLAYAIGIKAFPAVFLIAAIIAGIARYIAYRETFFLQITGWTCMAGFVYVLFMLLFIDIHVVFSWFGKAARSPWESTATLGGSLLFKPTLKNYLLTVFSRFTAPGVNSLKAAGILTLLIQSCIAVLVVFAVRPTGQKISPYRREEHLILISLLIALLPTFLPHWWATYNVIMAIPFINCMYILARFRPSAGTDGMRNNSLYFIALFLLTASYVLMNYYLSVIPWNIDSANPPLAAEMLVTYPPFLLMTAGTLLAYRWMKRLSKAPSPS